MIRTDYVKLTKTEAVAYRQKLKSGGSGIVIIKKGYEQPGIAEIDKRESRPMIASNTNQTEYSEEMFQEAISLTIGMPYAKRKPLSYTWKEEQEEIQEILEETPQDDEQDLYIIESPEYQDIVTRYTDKKGSLSYTLLNKDFIQFAARSKIVDKMVQDKQSVDNIIQYIVKQRLTDITGNRNLDDHTVNGIIQLLDEVSIRFVFRELQDEIRKKLAR
jgi:hypothetical protein